MSEGFRNKKNKKNMNKVILLGRLGQDWELKTLQSGQMVANNTMATSETHKDKNGERQQSTEWHNLTVWGKKADVLSKHTSKGSQLSIEGKIEYKKWDDSEGKSRVTPRILVNEFHFVGSKESKPESSFPPSGS